MNVKKSLQNRIRGWLPQPYEPDTNFHKFSQSNSFLALNKISASLFGLGIFFWGLASYLFIFSRDELGLTDLTRAVSPYWIESLILFVAGIGLTTFPLIHQFQRITKKKVGMVILGTSLIAFGIYLVFALSMQDVGTGFIATPVASFPLTIEIVIGGISIGLGSKIVQLVRAPASSTISYGSSEKNETKADKTKN